MRYHLCSELLGLDKITEGFQLIAGNVSLSKTGVWLTLSAAVIFIAQFSLYFEMRKGNNITKSHRKQTFCRRILAWFFFQFLFNAALIIMLQGEFSAIFRLDDSLILFYYNSYRITLDFRREYIAIPEYELRMLKFCMIRISLQP